MEVDGEVGQGRRRSRREKTEEEMMVRVSESPEEGSDGKGGSDQQVEGWSDLQRHPHARCTSL